MPVGAIIGGVASIGGALLGASSQKKAAKKAAGAAADNTAANNAFAQGIYNQNAGRLDPYSANGLRAGNALTDMLLGPAAAAAPGTGTGSGGGTGTGAGATPSALNDWQRIQGYLTDNIKQNFDPAAEQYIAANLNRLPANYSGPSWQQIQGYKTDNIAGNYERALSTFGGVLANAAPAPAPAPPPGTPATPAVPGAPGATPGVISTSPNSPGGYNPPAAFKQFTEGTNYKWRLNQGMDALNQGYAARGMLQSGAALQGINDYGQNMAANELAVYQDRLANQQGVGMGAASALAGVGQNMVGQVTANNNDATSVAINAAAARGQANSNMWGGIAGSIGNVLGGFGGSSYGGGFGGRGGIGGGYGGY